MKFQAVAEKTTNNFRDYFFAAPGKCILKLLMFVDLCILLYNVSYWYS